MTNPRFTVWILLAALLYAGGCGTPRRSSNPLAGWRVCDPVDTGDKAITDDYKRYIQSLPPEERKYIHEGYITQHEDGTGQHAVSIAMPRNGTGWAHVLIYDQSNTRVKAMRVAYPQIAYYIRRIFKDRDGNFWFGTQLDGVCRYDGKSLVFFTTNEGFSGNAVRGIVQDESGNLWFATDGGVCRYDGKTFARFTAKDGLSHDDVWSILKDRAGSLWFGTKGGVCRYDGKAFVSFPIPSAGGKDPSSRFTPQLVWAIFEDKAGNLWFGTDGDGVRKYDGKTFTTYTDKEGLGNNNVFSITGDKAGNIWFGTRGGGVSRYYGKSFTTFTEKDGLPSNSVWTMLEDRKGDLWFAASNKGACRYDGKSFTTFIDKKGLTRNYVQSIFEDKDGKLWFGFSGGVFRFDGKALVNFTRQSAKK